MSTADTWLSRLNVDPALVPAARVLRIRIGQLLINERIKNRDFKVPIHLALGHEAVAAAVDGIMQTGDALCLTHRNIHYNIARATSMKSEMEELLLTPEGVGNGWFGSMNMANPPAGIPYTSSILGNNLCVGTGVALAARVQNRKTATLIVTGDGAMEEGVFFETLELLKSFRLSTIVLVENNEWSLATRIEERRCAIHLDKLAQVFEIPYHRLEGNDVYAYTNHLKQIRARVIEEQEPALVEVSLTTLGYWHMKTLQQPDRKFINYHHGAAPTVELLDWPIIKDSEADPVHVLNRFADPDRLRTLATQVKQGLEDEIR